MTYPHSYVVGLPVILTVAADGTVTYEVDLSEAADDLAEAGVTDEQPNDDATLDHDAEIIGYAVENGTIRPTA